jgi:hypothetical protein
MEYTFIDAVTGALIAAPPRPATALGVPFQRHRLILSYPAGVPVPTAGNFTITHPWGATVFTFGEAKCVNNAGGLKCSMTRDLPLPGAIPPNFAAALGTGIAGTQSTFLRDPLAPQGFLGSATAVAAFTGAAAGSANSITVTDGLGNTGTTPTLTLLVGQTIGMDVQPGVNHDFGAVNMITPPAVPAPKTITITNTTGSDFTFAAGTLITAGVDAADFIIAPPTQPAAPAAAIADCAGATVLAAVPTAAPPTPAGVCGFDITFKPTVAAKGPRVATIHLAPAAVVAANSPPPVTLNLAGSAQVTVTTAAATPHGTITPDATVDPVTGNAPAGSPVTFTVTPSNKKFKVKAVDDNGTILGTVAAPATLPNTSPFTITTGAAAHTITATFMPSGDLDADGTLGLPDALKALRVVAGVQQADVDDPNNSALKVAPLVNGVPSAIDAKANPDIGDVLVILRKVLDLDKW